MDCPRCGNQLTNESAFCNRCGAKVQNELNPRRAAHLAVPPPRPARRAPVRPFPTVPSPQEKDNEEYPEEYEVYEEEDNSVADGGERVIFSITPAFYEVGLTYFWAALLSLLITGAVAFASGSLWMAVIASAIIFIFPIGRHIQFRHTVYTLTNIKVEIQSGIFSQTARNVPLRHIRDVTVSETFKERLIGIGDVLIDSDAVEGKIMMNNINSPRRYADLILDQLQRWR
jgi:membrane protein YdbS with pleckstrin-like domain